MASPSPKLAHKMSVMNVAVVGLTTSSQVDQGEGTGKSCLCNKFVTPHADRYSTNHHYIVNLSEFGNSVINNCHFLYWGEKSTALEDGSQVRFRIVEHTEFVEDMSFKPFPAQKPYHKRITATKLQSGGKLQYVDPNQLTLPDDFPDVGRFPDRAINVEGFIVCVDVSADFSPNSRYRNDTLKLIQVVQGAKKPLVIALTKCDRVGLPKIAEVNEFLSKIKRAPSVVEVSSHEGVNIDLCFLVLAHLIDSRKPKVRIVPYDEAYGTVKDRKTKNEKLFKSMLDKKLTDFTLSKSAAVGLVKHEPEWESVAEILGSSRCERLVGVKLGQLQVEAVMKQTEIFKEILPEYLKVVIPSVTPDETVEGCIETIKKHDQFDSYFVNIDNWTDDVQFLHLFSNKVPLAFVQKEGKSIVQEYLHALHMEIKRNHAKEVIKKALEETEDLTPGVKAKVAVENLGLQEEAELLEPDVLVKIYQERMNVIEQQCANDIHELLLERLDLFYDYIPDPKEIAEKLMDEPCMKKMELAFTRRNGIIVKHISFLEVLERGPYFTPEILEILGKNTPSLEALQESLSGHWASNPKTEVFNLVLLSSSSEDASILKSDIMNQCTGADIYTINNDQSYQLRMKCCHTGNEEMTSEKFIPQGVIVTISSLDQLEWTGGYALRNFISPSALYRGMPCVLLVITDDLSDESELLIQSEKLAASLQCILVSTPPTELPGRLIPPEIVNSVLPSLFDNFTITHSFIFNGPSRELDGLNFGVFSLPGDPPSVSSYLKSMLLSSQLIHFNEKKGIFFSKTALERQHKVVSLSFYSTINARDFPSCPVLGFIVLYSANRKASLSAVKWLIPRLHHIPILLVAVCDDQSSSTLIDEGRAYAEERGEKVEFIVCYSHLEALKLSQFYSQCFFSRFTSWRSQGLSEEMSARILKRKGNNSTRPLPMPVGGNGSAATAPSLPTLPKSLSRHSVALGGDYEAKSPNLRGHFSMKSMKLSSKKKPKVPPVSLSDDELDDSVYSDPNEVIKKFTKPQKRSPSELHRSNPAIPSSLPPPIADKERFKTLPLDSSSLTEYAMVPNSNTLGKLDTLTRKRRAGHETSPSRDSVSTPDSAQLSNDSLYSPVKESGSKHELMYSSATSPEAVYPNAIYDHLTPRSQRKLLEHQQRLGLYPGPEGVYSLADDTDPQPPMIHARAPPLPTQPPPSRPTEPHLYNTFNNTQLQLQKLQSQLNFVTEGIEVVRCNTGDSSPSKQRSQSPTAIYDFCEDPPSGSELQPHQLNLQSYNVKTLEGSPSPQKHPPTTHTQAPFIPPDYSSVPGDLPGSIPAVYDYASLPETRYSLQTQSHEGTPEAVYSLAEDTPNQSSQKPTTPPRRSPLIRNATPPPPSVPPKPVVVHDSKGNFWTNKKGSTPTNTPPMTRAIEHITPVDSLPEMIYALPGKKNQPPKKIPHMASIDNPDMIYAIPDKVPKSRPPPPPDDHDDDDDDDAPPPLPARNYDLSDIEDDDEECFNSDDEDDHKGGTQSHSKSTAATAPNPQPIGIYASLDEIMDDDSKSDTVEDSLVMEQMESIYENLNKFRKQQEQQHKALEATETVYEEPVYDSLEKIIEDVNKGKVATTPQPAQVTPSITMSTMATNPQPNKQLALTKKAIKLLKKNEKKAKKDIKKRLKLEAKQKKKEEEKRKKMEKALKKGKKIKQPIRKRYFESSLDSVVGDDGIPSFVKACIKIVERDGLESVGLYRISGKREDILKVQEMYDHDPNIDIDSIGVCTNAITGALKNFFKLLPESLIPEKMLPPLLDIPGSSDLSDQISKMREIFSSLPRANLATLRYLCEHLQKVQKSHEINKMTSSNLSIVFWPTLMRPPILDMADPTKQLGWQLAMAKMIENPNSVPEPETAV